MAKELVFLAKPAFDDSQSMERMLLRCFTALTGKTPSPDEIVELRARIAAMPAEIAKHPTEPA